MVTKRNTSKKVLRSICYVTSMFLLAYFSMYVFQVEYNKVFSKSDLEYRSAVDTFDGLKGSIVSFVIGFLSLPLYSLIRRYFSRALKNKNR